MVLVLDDHPIARQGLESIIKLHKPEEETLQAGTVREAIDITENRPIDTVFVDLNLHNESGFDFLEWIQKQNKSVRKLEINHHRVKVILLKQKKNE